MTDAVLAALAGEVLSTTIMTIVLSNCKHITDVGIAALAVKSALSTLDLSDTAATVAGIVAVAVRYMAPEAQASIDISFGPRTRGIEMKESCVVGFGGSRNTFANAHRPSFNSIKLSWRLHQLGFALQH